MPIIICSHKTNNKTYFIFSSISFTVACHEDGSDTSLYSAVVSSNFQSLDVDGLGACNESYGILNFHYTIYPVFSRFGEESLPTTVCDGIFNLSINKSTCDFCQMFLLDKRCSMQFYMVYQIKSNVYLLYSFIHVFIYNSITKCFWQRRLEKPLILIFSTLQSFFLVCLTCTIFFIIKSYCANGFSLP